MFYQELVPEATLRPVQDPTKSFKRAIKISVPIDIPPYSGVQII